MKTAYVSSAALLLTFALLFSPGAASDPTGPAVHHFEGTLTLPTYPWYDDPHPVLEAYEGSIYYPYTRQDHIGKTSAPRTYRTLSLENEYLRVTCIPELGGRIHSVLVKATGEEMFHRNDEIKPALIAMRGAWISGGIEWNPGPHGHTVTILSPVDVLVRENGDGSATLVVGNTEKMFRTRWTVELTLHPGRAYLDEAIRMYNPTDTIAPYYFWNCTAFPNLEGTRFIYPMTLGTDHNGTEFFHWPIHGGKDLTYLKNYPTMSSVFGYKCVFDFFGAYDVDLDKGIVSYANHHELPGKKAWTWGKDDFGIVSQMALSDAGPVHAQYIEVQSGPLLTQSDYGMLKPGREIRWREFWYPVHGLGDGFEYATRDVAAQVHRKDGVLELRLFSTAVFSGARCLVSQNGRTLLDTRVDLTPEQAVTFEMKAEDGPVEIQVRDAEDTVLMQYISPLDIPVVEEPDLTERPARADGRATPDELYAKAFLLHSQTSHDEARRAYQKVLEEDPLHASALWGLATLALARAEWADAEAYAGQAVERNPEHTDAWYALGVALMHLDDLEGARQAAYKAAFTPDKEGRGYFLVGRIEMRAGNYTEGLRAFTHALNKNTLDAAARNARLAALLALGEEEQVSRLAADAVSTDPTDFTLRAILALAQDRCDAYAEALARASGEKTFTAQEAACFLADLGLYAYAARLLEAVLTQGVEDPMSRYYAAWYRRQSGDDTAAAAHLDCAAALSKDGVLPARPEALPALEYAVRTRPGDGGARMLLGHLQGRFGRLEEAVGHWNAAVEQDRSLGIAWRLLALHAWKQQKDIEQAERMMSRALDTRPEDQILYRDLALLREQLGRREEGMALVEEMPRTRDVRYDIYLWLAQAYLDEQDYDACIGLLETARFSNWEGQTRPRDIFVSALMARGKNSFEAASFESALADFERALTFPENLEVGAAYELTDAETRYWIGKTLFALNRTGDAVSSWETGAAQRTSSDPQLPFIRITPEQDEHVRKCRTALEVLRTLGGSDS